MRLLQSIGVVAFLVCGSVSAMDVDGYEKLVKASEAPGEKSYVAKAFIDSYFTGVAETLQFLQTSSQNIYLRDKPTLCFPSGVQLSGPLIRGVIDGELKNQTTYRELLGPKWKEYQITGIIIPGLVRMFPCPQ